MKVYKTKTNTLHGTDFHEVREKAFNAYSDLKRKSKRRPYVRSAYFKKDKIFLDLYWDHLFGQKNWRDRMRRLRFFTCAIELIQKSHFDPERIENPENKSEILYRFAGTSKNNELFYVQIKENKSKKQKFLISTFPEK